MKVKRRGAVEVAGVVAGGVAEGEEAGAPRAEVVGEGLADADFPEAGVAQVVVEGEVGGSAEEDLQEEEVGEGDSKVTWEILYNLKSQLDIVVATFWQYISSAISFYLSDNTTTILMAIRNVSIVVTTFCGY